MISTSTTNSPDVDSDTHIEQTRPAHAVTEEKHQADKIKKQIIINQHTSVSANLSDLRLFMPIVQRPERASTPEALLAT